MPVCPGKGPENPGMQNKALGRLRMNGHFGVNAADETAVNMVLRMFEPKLQNIVQLNGHLLQKLRGLHIGVPPYVRPCLQTRPS
ncbi:hypothetical protein D3C75_892930 [compost metagenome]